MSGSSSSKRGRVGESEFRAFAERAGFNAHAPTTDLLGWDGLLELPADTKSPKSLDQRPGPLAVMVQVKTMSDLEDDLTLAVLERMAKEPLPWFIAFVELDERNFLSAVHVKHVDQELMGKILKRLRVAHAKQRTEDLHKQTLKVSAEGALRIEALDNEGLRSAFLAQIGDTASYSTRKVQARESLGFDENERYHANIRFKNPLVKSDLVEVVLGLTSREVDVASISMSQLRFGIPIPEKELRDCTIAFGPPPSMGKSRVAFASKSDPMNRVELEFDTLSAGPWADRDAQKIVLKSAVLKVILDVAQNEVHFAIRIQLPEQSSLAEWERASKVVQMLAAAPSDVLMHLEVLGKRMLDPVSCGTHAPVALTTDIRDVLSAGRACSHVLRHCGLSPEKEVVKADELYRLGENFADLVDGLGNEVATVNVVTQHVHAVLRHTAAVYLFNTVLELEAGFVSFVMGVAGPLKEENGEIVFQGVTQVLHVERIGRDGFAARNARYLADVSAAECAKDGRAVFAAWSRHATSSLESCEPDHTTRNPTGERS